MVEHMTSLPRRARGWLSRDSGFRKATESYDGESLESLKASCSQAGTALKSNDAFLAINPQVYTMLESAETETQANRAIDLVYNFADEHRIWMELTP